MNPQKLIIKFKKENFYLLALHRVGCWQIMGLACMVRGSPIGGSEYPPRQQGKIRWNVPLKCNVYAYHRMSSTIT